MPTEPTTPHPCLHFVVDALQECHQRNLSLPLYSRFFMRENCQQLGKRVFETCEKVAEVTQYFTVPYVAASSEK